jgi:phenylalanyl-tRNA synthetase beta chain
MKVSVNWVREYLQFELPAVDELVARIGSQLGEVEGVTSIGTKYQGAVVVKVVECSKLENSDHLNLCYVDDGGVTANVNRRDDGLVQVVCGAPNVTAGATVVWLPPGSTVPSTYDTDPFVLEARELRGTVSNGMLASPKELALGDNHEGLLLLDGDVQPGTTLVDAYKLDDQIIDIENKMFTHRPDCFGQLGVAREVAGIFGKPFVSPDWYTQPDELSMGDGLLLTVANEIPQEVPRFMAVTLKDIQIKPSPVWLQTQLSRVGVRPINNVVDITNYIMLLTGQPLHAYDYDKVASLSDGEGAALVVRYPQKDERLELLSGKTVTPRDQAIIIATNKQAIGLGGVMGGGNTEVDDSTSNIILECATFNMYSIRRTSMAHGLFTDAVTRFNKGQSPLQNKAVMARAVKMLQELSQATIASTIIDDNHVVGTPPAVQVSADFINQRLGLNLQASEMAELLTNVECGVVQDGETLTVTAPFWRTDIETREDVVEEVGRLYGFDKLPLELPGRDIAPAMQDPLLIQKKLIRNSLARAGANEVLTYSFVHGNLLDKAGQNRQQAYKLSNALSPDLQYYRLSALPSLLDKVHANIKAGYPQFALFELSKAHGTDHVDNSGLPLEFEDLDLVYASKQAQPGAAFYYARHYLDTLAHDLGVQLTYRPFTEDPKDPMTEPYDLSRSAEVLIDDQVLGIVGEFKVSVGKGFKLPKYSAGFSVSQRQLLKSRSVQKSRYQELPRYPKIEQDICLRVGADTRYADLFELVTATLQEVQPERTTFSVSPLDIYQREGDVEHRQVTFRVGLSSFERTMTDQEMAHLLQQVADRAANEYNAERV